MVNEEFKIMLDKRSFKLDNNRNKNLNNTYEKETKIPRNWRLQF